MATSKKTATQSASFASFASISDLGFKQSQLNATLDDMARYALEQFGAGFPEMSPNDEEHKAKIEELYNGYLSHFATLPNRKPVTYIILDKGAVAQWVAEADHNKDTKAERFTVNVHAVMAHSQQLFGKFKNGDASAEIMPKSWQPGYHAIAADIRKAVSTHQSRRFKELKRKAKEIQNPNGTERKRDATKDIAVRIKAEQEALFKSCRTARDSRGDVTADPDRMTLGFELFNAIYFSDYDIPTVRKMFSEMIAKLKHQQ